MAFHLHKCSSTTSVSLSVLLFAVALFEMTPQQAAAQAVPPAPSGAASLPPTAAPPPPTSEQAFVPPKAIPSSVMKNWPVYSMDARLAHREGVVLLSVTVSAEGNATDVKVARSSNFRDLDVAAVQAVRNWKFTPATRDGVATETTANLPINFSLAKAEKAPEPAAASAAPAPPQSAAAPKPPPKPKPKVAKKLPQKPVAMPKTETAAPAAQPEPAQSEPPR